MKNLKIGTRLTISFLLVVALMIAVSGIGVFKMKAMNAEANLLAHDRGPKIVTVHDYIVRLNREARYFRNIILFKDPARIKQELDKLEVAKKEAGEKFDILDKGIKSTKGRELLGVISNHRQKFGSLIGRFDSLVEQGKKDEAFELLVGDLRPVQLAYMNALNDLIDYQVSLMKQSGEAAESAYESARLIMLGLTGGAFFLAIIIAIWITRSITGPLNEAVKVAQTVAGGDLTGKVEVQSTDETGQLMQALKDMNESLVRTVGNVRASSDIIATASQQIAAGNMDLSSRTEQQASSLEETASSMEELTSTVRQNADNARQANLLAVTASDVAVKGGVVVGEVVETMSAINDSSKKMSDIINVIDGIAFQTNILALNAAVEAARAGEQGRGFAVVATEVRSLAQRSANAAREIKELIDDSVEKVGQGTQLVESAGSTMEEVVASIKRVHDIMGEITAASQEQSEGIEQVNQAIIQMDQVTQQNAALVEEAAAASESLQGESVNLTEVVSVFRLDANQFSSTNTSTSGAASSHKKLAVVAKTDRRGPNRAQNVARLPSASTKVALPERAKAANAPASEDWEEF